MRKDFVHDSQVDTCVVCKDAGKLDPADVDEWLWADMDEELGPGAIVKKLPNFPSIPKNAVWTQWTENNGRDILWSECVVKN